MYNDDAADKSTLELAMQQKRAIAEIQIDVHSVKELDTINRQFTGEISVVVRWAKKDSEGDKPDHENTPKFLPYNLENSFIDVDQQIIYGPRIAHKSRKYESHFVEHWRNNKKVWELVYIFSGVWTIQADHQVDPLLEFPFDQQDIGFELILLNSDKFVLEFVKNYQDNLNAIRFQKGAFQSGEFEVENMAIVLWHEFNEQTSSIDHGLSVLVAAKRKWKYYWNQVGIFTFLLAALSFVAYFFEPSDLGSRLGHLTTLILAQIASLYVVDASLPKLSFYTTLDYYVLFSFMTTCVVTISSCCIYLIEDEDEAWKWDIRSLYICLAYTAAYHIYMIWTWFRITKKKDKEADIEKEQEAKEEDIKVIRKLLTRMKYVDTIREEMNIEDVDTVYTCLNFEFPKE